jgi:hypothetical protein
LESGCDAGPDRQNAVVPVIERSNVAVCTALRKRIVESCPRDLSKAFIAWLLEDFNQTADLLSLAARALKREGAGQDFQSIAILGFAAHAGILSEPELAALKKSLSRLAGRSPVVSGVPMPFCADAVGILGVALGTAVIANAETTGQVVGWTMRFLKTAYDRDSAEDWRRCLFAAADLKIGSPLRLTFPNGAAVADVRLALQAKRLIHCADSQVRQDEARVQQIALQELSAEVGCERAALCLAGVEWVIRRDGEQSCPVGVFTEQILKNAPEPSHENERSDVDATSRKKRGRPTKIPDELKERALTAQGTKARAQILYRCSYPTIQQQRNVCSILKHYRKKSARERVEQLPAFIQH